MFKIYRSKLVLLTALSVCVLIFTQCERDIDEFEGPPLNELFGPFSIQEEFAVSATNVDFSTGEKVHFTARFSRITDWKIEISSDNSSSVKVIEGRSKVIDASNASWDGTTTTFPVFNTGPCTVVLSIDADTSMHNASVTVDGLLQPDGILISDFETAIDPDWTLFVQTGANMSFRTENKVQAPVGNRYFDLGGAVSWDYLIGLFDIPSTSVSPEGFGLPSNPDEVYFNVILNRPDSLPNGFLLFRFSEDENGDGRFDEDNEDQYAFQIDDFDSGWNIVSIKYSDLEYLINGNPADPKGDGVKDPEALATISCLFLADPSSGYAQVLMDYMVLTTGGPLKL